MPRPAKGAIVPTKTGGYALRFTAYGKRRYLTLDPSWDRDRAEAELQNVMADVRRGIWRPPNPVVESAPAPADDPTFHVFASQWFLMREAEGLAESTLAAIQWRLSDVLLPHFADYRLSQITVEAVDHYRAEQVRQRDRLAAARDRGEDMPTRPLCNNTINRTIQLLAQVLELAVEYGHTQANPASGKRRKLKAEQPRRAYLDSADQIAALLDAAGEYRSGVPRRPPARQPARADRNADLRWAAYLGGVGAAVGRRGLGHGLADRPRLQDGRWS